MKQIRINPENIIVFRLETDEETEDGWRFVISLSTIIFELSNKV